ncbi:hypothetical protein [Pseudorhodoferax sp.]|uniref:hypothetical protein n=1 Tax=Pseudorhodoferax sp. TaxID=1993553 RepID=UPI0039E7121B
MLQHLGNKCVRGPLDAFFSALGGRAQAVRAISESALCRARRKLKASAFVVLGSGFRAGTAKAAPARWYGLRMVVGDGSCLRLPRWRGHALAFGDGPARMARS